MHIQPVKAGSEVHNKRLKALDYVHPDLSHDNEYWESDNQQNRLQTLKDLVKAKTGRKMQAKATPILEGVVVISPTTTMSDLKELAATLKKKFGIECFQIAIHRDEGYKKSDGVKLNLHAHMVFDWMNHDTGKSLRTSRQDMAELQTIVADVLHMERGRSSDRKHLSAIQYKNMAASERLEQQQEELEHLNVAKERKEAAVKAAKMAVETVSDKLGVSSRAKERKALKSKINALEGEKKELTNKIEDMRKSLPSIVATVKKEVEDKYKPEIAQLRMEKNSTAEECRRLRAAAQENERKNNLLKWCTDAGIEALAVFKDLWRKGEALYSGLLKWGEWQANARNAKLTADAKGLRVDGQPLSYWVTSNQRQEGRKRGLSM